MEKRPIQKGSGHAGVSLSLQLKITEEKPSPGVRTN
jgi:hypothetical protein